MACHSSSRFPYSLPLTYHPHHCRLPRITHTFGFAGPPPLSALLLALFGMVTRDKLAPLGICAYDLPALGSPSPFMGHAFSGSFSLHCLWWNWLACHFRPPAYTAPVSFLHVKVLTGPVCAPRRMVHAVCFLHLPLSPRILHCSLLAFSGCYDLYGQLPTGLAHWEVFSSLILASAGLILY